MNNLADDPADDLFEYGYSHERNLNRDGSYAPIATDFQPRWHRTREEAAAACENDLRWGLDTFLIRRPKPAAPERISGPIVKRS